MGTEFYGVRARWVLGLPLCRLENKKIKLVIVPVEWKESFIR